MGEYIPVAPVNDQARKHNQSLPGLGGVFNYVNFHAYHYAGNNPVVLTDPDGRFIPDADGNLIAEAGDSPWTLHNFLGISFQEALDITVTQGITVDKNGISSMKEGQKITSDNVYTRSITRTRNVLTLDQLEAMGYKPLKNFNCWGTAITGSKGDEIKIGVSRDYWHPKQFDNALYFHYTEVNDTEAVFGKTILRFANSVETKHAAVFYGRSNDGTVYVYTKNGWYAKPEVMKLSDLLLKCPEYGFVTDCFNFRR
jgi:hypothetical protein